MSDNYYDNFNVYISMHRSFDRVTIKKKKHSNIGRRVDKRVEGGPSIKSVSEFIIPTNRVTESSST